MYPEVAQKASLYEFLHRVDEDLARGCMEAGCIHCGGRLHRASYARTPRGGPDTIPEQWCVRLGLCCGARACRRRTLPDSSLFLGRRVYWGGVVLVVAALRQRRPEGASARTLRRLFGVSWRTVLRWMEWFRETFPHTPWWRSLRGRVSTQVRDSDLPAGLIELFAEASQDEEKALSECLKFLSTGCQTA